MPDTPNDPQLDQPWTKIWWSMQVWLMHSESVSQLRSWLRYAFDLEDLQVDQSIPSVQHGVISSLGTHTIWVVPEGTDMANVAAQTSHSIPPSGLCFISVESELPGRAFGAISWCVDNNDAAVQRVTVVGWSHPSDEDPPMFPVDLAVVEDPAQIPDEDLDPSSLLVVAAGIWRAIAAHCNTATTAVSFAQYPRVEYLVS